MPTCEQISARLATAQTELDALTATLHDEKERFQKALAVAHIEGKSTPKEPALIEQTAARIEPLEAELRVLPELLREQRIADYEKLLADAKAECAQNYTKAVTTRDATDRAAQEFANCQRAESQAKSAWHGSESRIFTYELEIIRLRKEATPT